LHTQEGIFYYRFLSALAVRSPNPPDAAQRPQSDLTSDVQDELMLILLKHEHADNQREDS